MWYAKSLWIAVVMLLVCVSHRAIASAQQGMHERTCPPSSLSVVTQDNARTIHKPLPVRGAAWLHVAQANACACPAITCSELQRSPACHVSCARGRSAYCQCGSCTGISLSSANSCSCR